MKSRGEIPHDKCVDSSLAFLFEGYQFIQKRCRRYQSDIFRTRLLGEKVICMSGEEAAKVFYNNNLFNRKGAAPKRIQKTLFGENGVQGLDGKEHQNRKLMFMSIMTPQNLKMLEAITLRQWEINSSRWKNRENKVLFDESQIIMCQVACKWAGIPLRKSEVNIRAKDMGKMIDAFGGIGPRYQKGKCARQRTEKWMKGIIEQIRTKELCPPIGSAAYTIAWHRDLDAKLLSSQIASVELINIVRPIVAIATYITFGALAMKEHPECVEKLRIGDENYSKMFVQEVRRFYSFAPLVAARVSKNFIWRQCHFKKGTLVLFDIHGNNHNKVLFKSPDKFMPERFLNRKENSFDFVPQGGGDCYTGHRCAGEGVTIVIMKESLKFLVNNINYKVPKQNLNYNLARIPTLPKSGFIITINKK